MLDCYTFEGKVSFMTFMGPEEHPVAFTLLVAPDADLSLHNMAGKAICQFLINEHFQIEDDIMESDEF